MGRPLRSPLLLALLSVGIFSCAHPAQKLEKRGPASIGSTTARLPLLVSAKLLLRCEGENRMKVAESEKTFFFPDAGPFAEANGGLVPVLTARLQILSDELVRDTAIRHCGREADIREVKPLSIHSGRWSAPVPFECARTGCILSPYDDGVRDLVKFAPEARGESSILRESAFTGGEEITDKLPTSCRHPIRAQACFGDCVSDDPACQADGTFRETLSTPSYLAEEPLAMCGDALYEKLARDGTSKALRPLECRLFFFKELFRRVHAGLTCSAFRAQIPSCSRF